MAYTQEDYGACEEYAREALEASQQEGDALAEAYARCELGLVAMNRGDLEEAASRFEEALPLFRRSGEEGTVPLARAWLGTALLLRGDQDRAVPVFEEGLEQARDVGATGSVPTAHSTIWPRSRSPATTTNWRPLCSKKG